MMSAMNRQGRCLLFEVAGLAVCQHMMAALCADVDREIKEREAKITALATPDAVDVTVELMKLRREMDMLTQARLIEGREGR